METVEADRNECGRTNRKFEEKPVEREVQQQQKVKRGRQRDLHHRLKFCNNKRKQRSVAEMFSSIGVNEVFCNDSHTVRVSPERSSPNTVILQTPQGLPLYIYPLFMEGEDAPSFEYVITFIHALL